MKKILFLIAVTAITFTSCKKDDPKSNEDCFDCTTSAQGISTTSTYCYTDGDNFYTVTVSGNSQQVEIPEGSNWEEIKAGLELICD